MNARLAADPMDRHDMGMMKMSGGLNLDLEPLHLLRVHRCREGEQLQGHTAAHRDLLGSVGRRVALKLLPFTAAMDPRQVQRFQVEVQAAAHLHHPHIVPVHEVGCESGIHYYAMRLILGKPLSAIIQGLRDSRIGGLPANLSSQTQITETAVLMLSDPAARSELPRGRTIYHEIARLGFEAADASSMPTCSASFTATSNRPTYCLTRTGISGLLILDWRGFRAIRV